MMDLHRYFPDWADRPSGPDAQHESDRNSYLAGGYADEFGYGSSLGEPPAIAPVEGDPEGGRLWREQIGGLHPGYPECPKPLDRFDRAGSAVVSALHRLRPVPRPAPAPFRVIQVGPRSRDSLRHAALRFAVISYIVERLIRRQRLNDIL
ncbi:MAG: hypothetical protein HIU85_10945 [Proteobacteria bacterium]|nr:hypothetical protein [Pseudomonadota bacterium]